MFERISLAALATIGWSLALWLYVRPSPKPQIESVEVVKFVDRVVERETVKEIKMPTGTTIVTRTVERDKQGKSERLTTTIPVQPLTRYQVGAGVQLGRELLMNQPTYSFEVGARLGDSPLWIKSQLTSTREIFVGLSLEF
jgi:hypothetical protein